jgi:hypothetical protein
VKYVQPALLEREAVVNAILETENRMRVETRRLAAMVHRLQKREANYRKALEARGCSEKELNRIRAGGDYDPADYA